MSPDEFEVGHLVRWTLDDGDVVGVIKELDNHRITVDWDDGKTPPITRRITEWEASLLSCSIGAEATVLEKLESVVGPADTPS